MSDGCVLKKRAETVSTGKGSVSLVQFYARRLQPAEPVHLNDVGLTVFAVAAGTYSVNVDG